MLPLELLTLTPDALIDLYVLDLNPINENRIERFCNWEQVNGAFVQFQGQVYTPMPLDASGFELNSRGQMPTPKMQFSNIFSLITDLCLRYDDLVGARVTRKRAFAKHLDGQPESDPSKEFLPEVYYVRRKESETELTVSFELKRSLDMGINAKLPNRLMLKSLCIWAYRSSECAYTGGPVADENDNPTGDPARDRCGKRVRSCKFRFGEFGELNFSSFPGLDDV